MSNVLDFGVNGLTPSKVGGTGTAVKYFPRPLPGWAGAAGAGPGGSLPTTPSSASAVGALWLPAQNVFNGQQFNVLASGSFGSDSGDPSGTVNIAVYAVTGSLSSPVYTALGQTGAVAPTFASAQPWAVDLSLIGDSDSGILSGSYLAVDGNAIVTPAVVLTRLTGFNFNTGNPALQQGAVLGFVVGVTFGTSDATNKASLYEFTIES